MMLADEITFRCIYTPVADKPMRVVFFVSGGGGNLNCGLQLQQQYPDKIQIALVVSDRPGTRAAEMALADGIPVLEYDFERDVGNYKVCRASPEKYAAYLTGAELFHDRVLADIRQQEVRDGKMDLAVLSYRRIIRGSLLDYFEDRMINQHPGDLAVINSEAPGVRLLTGYDPVMKALRQGFRQTRTSTIMVRKGTDTGEILARGPEVFFASQVAERGHADAHEQRQKVLSDWPVLRFVLMGIADGRFSLSEGVFFSDGCRRLRYDSVLLPYGGVDIKK